MKSSYDAVVRCVYLLMYFPQLADVYGNVFSVRLGSEKMVFVSGYKMVKEAIVTQAENFVDRPSSPLTNRFYSETPGASFSSLMLCRIYFP